MERYGLEHRRRSSQPALGASGAVNSIVIAQICLFPTQTVLLYGILPMPAALFGLMWIAGDVGGMLQVRALKLFPIASLGLSEECSSRQSMGSGSRPAHICMVWRKAYSTRFKSMIFMTGPLSTDSLSSLCQRYLNAYAFNGMASHGLCCIFQDCSHPAMWLAVFQLLLHFCCFRWL